MNPAPSSEIAFDSDKLKLLFYWVRERESIRQKKEAGKPKPWTIDPILQSTRFCNVRRMDDKVSRWLLKEWYEPGVPYSQILANAGMARLINWPDSLDIFRHYELNQYWNPVNAVKAMREARATGKLFTGAYIINGIAGQDKLKTVLDQFHTLYLHPELVDDTNMHLTHGLLQQVKGIGSFIGGQIVADLRHVWQGQWNDRDTWAPLGPGSRRGIAWLLGWDGVEQLTAMKQVEFEYLLLVLARNFNENLKSVMVDRQLEMHDIQNCLCEFDKYCRLKFGTGRAKNKYPGL